MLSDYPKTKTECADLVEKIWTAQRNNLKRNALGEVLSTYRRLLHLDERGPWYRVLPNSHCTKCGGLIFEKVSPFPMVTPGGNRIKGCPRCKTMSWKMRHDTAAMGDPVELE